MIRIGCMVWMLLFVAPPLGNASDADVAESLGKMEVQLALKLVDGKVSVNRVNSDAVSPQLLADLKKLRNLESLELSGIDNPGQAACLSGLSSLTGLKELKLSGSNVDDQAMLGLAALTNLESLSLFDVLVGKQGLKALSGMQNLRRLELSDYVELNREAGEEIAKLQSLEYFQPYGKYAAGALSTLHALPKLKHVSVGSLGINAKLAELGGIPTIERITIFRAEVDQVTTGYLGRLKNLKWLEFENCRLTPEAIIGVRALRLELLECHGISPLTMNELTKGMPSGFRGSLKVFGSRKLER